MSPNRKAELQRKLAMAPVPKPPAGLAERIKSDIPQPLRFDVVKERQRLSQSVAFNMRVAASILLLISSLYVVLHLLSRAERSEMVALRKTAATEPRTAVLDTAPPQGAPPPPPKPAPAVAEAKTEVKKKNAAENRPVTIIAEAKPEPARLRHEEAPAPPPIPSQPAAGGAPPSVRESVTIARNAPPSVRESVTIAQNAQPAATSRAAGSDATSVAKATPASVQAAAPAPPPAPAPAVNGILSEARAADLVLEPKALFGLKTDSSLQKSAAPAKPPRRMRIDAEGVMRDGKPLLRISIDAPEISPAAAGVKIDIDWRVPHEAIAGFSDATESALPSRASITALYSLDLPPALGRRAVIATVRLHYRSVKDGSEKTIERTIRRSDIHSWAEASGRTKSAIEAK